MHTHVCKGDGPGLGAGACDRRWSQAAQAGVSKVLGRRRPWFLLLFKLQQRKEGCPSAGAWPFRKGWIGWARVGAPGPYPVPQGPVWQVYALTLRLSPQRGVNTDSGSICREASFEGISK